MRLVIATEAPTPHNNHLFRTLARMYPDLHCSVHYIYHERNVPGRPWRDLEAAIPGWVVRTGVSRWFDWRVFREAVAAKRQGALFVIGWNHPLLACLILLAGLLRLPLLTWFDTPAVVPRRRFWRDGLKRMLITCINHAPGTVFVTGREAMHRLGRMGIKAEKMRMLPFFVPSFPELSAANIAATRKRYGLGEDAVMLLAAGRWIETKGYDVLLCALQGLNARTHWHLCLVGSGPMQAQLERLAAHPSLRGHVTMVPWLEAGELAQHMAACDVFVAPARMDPFPTTIIQALQMGKPVVATSQVYSALEFVRDGVNGRIIPPEDAQTLREALADIIEDGEKRRRMAGAAMVELSRWPVERGAEAIYHAMACLPSS